MFTKEKSQIMKGIAILMLLMHHNFMSPGQYEGYVVSFAPFPATFINHLSDFGKICVPIFVFITGYGLTLSLQKYKNDFSAASQSKWTMVRLAKLLSGVWFVQVLSMIICQIADGRTQTVYFSEGIATGVYRILVDLFGMSKVFHIKSLNGTWWYIGAAVFFIILIPFLFRACKQFGCLPVLFLNILLPRLIGFRYRNSVQPYPFVTALILGIIFAQSDVFKRLDEWKPLKNEKANNILRFGMDTVILLLLYCSYGNFPIKYAWDWNWGLIPVFVIYYCCRYVAVIPVLNQILSYIGKHSLNIFMIHTFFRFIYLGDFVYSFKHFMLIHVVLLLMSLAASVLVELLKKLVRYDKIVAKSITVLENSNFI